MSKIEKLVKLLPFGTSLIMVASSLKLSIYYSVFNIRIVDYLGIGEYLPLFIDELHELLFIIIGLLVGFLLFSLFNLKATSKEEFEERKGDKKLRKIWVISFFTLLLITVIAGYFRFPTLSERLEQIPTFFVIIVIMLFVISTTYKKVNPNLGYAAFLSILVVPLLITGYAEAFTIIDNRNDLDYVLFFNNDTIQTTNTLHYLGKSEDYIFLYNLETKATSVKLTKDLRELRINKRTNY